MACVLAGEIHDLAALESEPVSRPGIERVQLLTEVSAVVPGKPFTVGLKLHPMPGHHTYWRGPGIVGVATRLDWTLPDGFEVGDMTWPPPTLVDMAGFMAHGYKEPVLLLTELRAPADLHGTEIVIEARASWMSCSVSCNPGIADLRLSLPVAKEGEEPEIDTAAAKAFEMVRESAPKTAPEDWSFAVRLRSPDRIELTATIPGIAAAAARAIHVFCDDMQVDSDEPQTIEAIDETKGIVRILLTRPEFAPKSPEVLSGVLYCPVGWPGTGSSHVEFSAPWPSGSFPE